ncbi:MAG TPA: divalent-cation tolerance protein CutA [Rhizomicrobium sp.]|nr:divalent-cation tolerance protein CutA [Rhizomicrobium sp.]
METHRYGMLMTTVGNREDAERIARSLIEENLAACVQFISIESLYRWQGGVANEPELLMLVKTKTDLFDQSIAAIKASHPYETPEIVATRFENGHADYFAWIDSVTK